MNNQNEKPAPMLSIRSLMGLALSAILLVTMSGCGPSPGAEYAVKTLEITHRIPGSVQGWGMVLDPWFKGGQVNLEDLARTKTMGNESMKQIRDAVYAVEVPSDPKSKEFAELVQGYCDWQVETFIGTLNEVSELAEQENPASLPTLQKASALLQPLEDAEQEWVKKINAQAKKLGLQVK